MVTVVELVAVIVNTPELIALNTRCVKIAISPATTALPCDCSRAFADVGKNAMLVIL
jgi:hypothetical protein